MKAEFEDLNETRKSVRVEIPSSNAAMDDSARMAVLRSAPLQRLPEGYEGQYLGIRFWFTYLGN